MNIVEGNNFEKEEHQVVSKKRVAGYGEVLIV